MVHHWKNCGRKRVKEAEVRKLVQDSPCSSNDQCDMFIFGDPDQLCDPGGLLPEKRYQVYTTLLSGVEQVREAAEEQRKAAGLAQQIQMTQRQAEVGRIACPTVSSVIFGPVCVAKKCVVPIDQSPYAPPRK
jgi:hypothetical protein